ncbi:uncharacterized protein LOC133925816 [Phragmites australis]|uniref:uncharacterized protein LOC133925816 n=1 Tax=Phragmites australis TaxID=29695 RepID=UPI002D77C110|nr:uncharacterized protein LOC133925816 [Phragmites australis]
MARAASASIAFNGLCVGISVAALFSFFLSQSAPDAIDGAPVARLDLDAAAQVMLLVAAVATFFTAVTFIYVHLNNGGGGGRGAGVGDRRFPEVMFFILCASMRLLDIFLFLQPGAMDGVAQAQLLFGMAAVHVLPPAATATFFLAMALIYVNVLTAGSDSATAVNEQNPAVVELLTMMTLSATLVTVMLSLGIITLAFDTK